MRELFAADHVLGCGSQRSGKDNVICTRQHLAELGGWEDLVHKIWHGSFRMLAYADGPHAEAGGVFCDVAANAAKTYQA